MKRMFWLLIIHNEFVFVFSIPDSDEEHDLQRRLCVHVCVNAENWDELWVYQWEPEPCVCVGLCVWLESLCTHRGFREVTIPHYTSNCHTSCQTLGSCRHQPLGRVRQIGSTWSSSVSASILADGPTVSGHPSLNQLAIILHLAFSTAFL